MRPRVFLAPAVLLALAGCGTLTGAPPLPPATGVAQAPVQGGRFLAFVGPRRQHAPPFLGVPNTNFYTLRSWLDTRTGARVTQLYVEDSYSGPERKFDAAQAAGQPLKFVPVSKNEITCTPACSYAEEFGAELPEPLMRAHLQGLRVVFTAKSGARLTIAVPGDLIEQQLAALDRARAARKTAAVAPAPPRS